MSDTDHPEDTMAAITNGADATRVSTILPWLGVSAERNSGL